MKKSWSRKRTESKWLTDGFSPHSSSPGMKKSTSTIPKVFISIYQKEKSLVGDNKSCMGCTATSDWNKWLFSKMACGVLLLRKLRLIPLLFERDYDTTGSGHFLECWTDIERRTQMLIVSYYRNHLVPFPSCIWERKKKLRVLNCCFETSLWSLGKLWWLYLTLCRLNDRCLFWKRVLWIISKIVLNFRKLLWPCDNVSRIVRSVDSSARRNCL